MVGVRRRNAGAHPIRVGLVDGIAQGRTEISLCSMGSRGERSLPGHGGFGGSLEAPPNGGAAAKRLRGVNRRYGCVVERGSMPELRHWPGGCNGGAQRVPLPRWFCSTKHILRNAERPPKCTVHADNRREADSKRHAACRPMHRFIASNTGLIGDTVGNPPQVRSSFCNGREHLNFGKSKRGKNALDNAEIRFLNLLIQIVVLCLTKIKAGGLLWLYRNSTRRHLKLRP